MKKTITLFMCIITLGACSYFNKDEALKTYNEPRFVDENPIELNVNRIEVISEFSPTFKRPNVEHLFPVSIEKTAKLWGKDRLEAADYSSPKEAFVIIKDASVTEELIKSDKLLSKDQLKYKASLHVVVKVRDSQSFSSAETEIQAWRELVIPYDTSIADKEKYWNGMVEKLFNDFNNQMTNNINQYLKQYVKTGYVRPAYE